MANDLSHSGIQRNLFIHIKFELFQRLVSLPPNLVPPNGYLTCGCIVRQWIKRKCINTNTENGKIFQAEVKSKSKLFIMCIRWMYVAELQWVNGKKFRLQLKLFIFQMKNVCMKMYKMKNLSMKFQFSYQQIHLQSIKLRQVL